MHKTKTQKRRQKTKGEKKKMKPTTFQCSVWYCASSGRVAAVWPGKEPLQVPLGDQPAGLQTNTSGMAEQT